MPTSPCTTRTSSSTSNWPTTQENLLLPPALQLQRPLAVALHEFAAHPPQVPLGRVTVLLCRLKKSEAVEPFEAEKPTHNKRVRKDVADIHGKGIRMTNSFYRWHNKSGMNTKQATEFECRLRDYSQSWTVNPEESNFDNLVKPIHYQDVEPKVYKDSELICPRQRRLFRVTQ